MNPILEPPLDKPRYMKLGLACFLLLTTCACNAVISKRVVGEKPAKIAAKDWEGNWVTTDGTARVKVVDADKGMLKVFWLEEEKGGKPIMKTADVELRESGDWLFANTKEEEKARGYIWGRIKNEDRQIIIWSPDSKGVARLVKEGVLPGTLDKDDVIVDQLTAKHLKLITSGERGVLFEWDKPTVFVKAGN